MMSVALFAPVMLFAQTPAGPYTGLVQCDGVVLPTDENAALRKKCSFVELINQIQFLINWGITFLLLVTTALFAYTGIMYMYAGFTGSVSEAESAKKKFTNIFWGIIIVLFAWLVVRTALNWLIDPAFGGLDLLAK